MSPKNAQYMMTRIVAWLVLMAIATACGLNPFSFTVVFITWLMSLWVMR